MTDTEELIPAWRASHAIVALVDVVHQDDENGEHCGGFCRACADFYVALNTLVIEHTREPSND